jgi:hypothetical protein
MSRKLSLVVVLSGFAFAAPTVVRAQVRSFTSTSRAPQPTDIPREHLPPPGMCRIWLDNVPATQQPAPTDCPTAIRRKPQKARVIFGENAPRKDELPKDTLKTKKP